MNADTQTINFKVDGENFGNFKLKKNNRRMKLYIKLNQEETQQWETLKAALTGDTMGDDLLARILFFKGIHSITEELNQRVENMTEEEREAVLSQVSEEQVAAATKLAEQELAAEEEDETAENSND